MLVCVRLCVIKRAVVMGTLQFVAVISTWARFTPLVKLGDYGEPPQTWSNGTRQMFTTVTLFESPPSTFVSCLRSTWIVQLIVYLACWVRVLPQTVGLEACAYAFMANLRVYGTSNGIVTWLQRARSVSIFVSKSGAGSGKGRRGMSGLFARQPGA